MPRRPIRERAMTNTERVQRYREKHGLTKPSPAAEIARLTARVAELEAALAAQPAPAPETSPLAAENLRLRSRVGALEAEIRRLSAQPHPAAPPRPAREPRPVDEQVAALQAQIVRLRQENRVLAGRLRDARDRERETNIFNISTADLRTIRLRLHPDGETDPSRKRRLERALQVFSSLDMREVDSNGQPVQRPSKEPR